MVRFANEKQTVIILILLDEFRAEKERCELRKLRECTEKRKARFIQGDGRRPVRNLPMTARENYGYFFSKTGLSVRFKILSIWVAAPR